MSECALLGYAEIAELLDVKVETVRQWQWAKVLPDPDGPAVHGKATWNPTTIRVWAEQTGRLPSS